jgi:hypothetical protein
MWKNGCMDFYLNSMKNYVLHFGLVLFSLLLSVVLDLTVSSFL